MTYYKFSAVATACLLTTFAVAVHADDNTALSSTCTPAPPVGTHAIELARQAAAQRNAEAEWMLACAYRKGWGVAQNPETAFDWALRAAKRGNPAAETWVIQRLQTVGWDTERDLAESLLILRKVADNGDARAQSTLAQFYLRGVGGVEKNYLEAERLLSLAARSGDPKDVVMLAQARELRQRQEKLERQQSEQLATEARKKNEQDAEENRWARETPERIARRAEITAAVNRRFTSDDFNYTCWSYAYQIDGMSAPGNMVQAQYQFDQIRMLARNYETCVRDYRPPAVQALVPVWPWLLPNERTSIVKLYERGFQIIKESVPQEVRNLQNGLKETAEWLDIHQQSIAADRRATEDNRRFWRQLSNQLDSVGKSLRPPTKIDIDSNEFSARVNEGRDRSADGAKAAPGSQSAPSTAVLTKEVNTVDARRQTKFAADEARAQQNMADSRKRAEAVERDANTRDQVRAGTPCKPGPGACSVTK